VSWTRREGRALANLALTGEALFAELDGYLRVHNPHLTDIRVEQASPTDGYDTHGRLPRRWYSVTYLADDGEGQ